MFHIMISFHSGLSKLAHLNLEGCAVTAVCLEVISGFVSFPGSTVHLSFQSPCSFLVANRVVPVAPVI
jgi:hypothetical protein